MQALQATPSEQQMAAASASTPRAVPVLSADLRSLLEGEVVDGPATELFTVERALRIGGGGLKSLPPDALKTALSQLDLLGCRTPGLGILRLQMARQLATNEAREQASRSATEVKWLPIGATPPRARESANSTLRFDSGFPDTVSTAAGRDFD